MDKPVLSHADTYFAISKALDRAGVMNHAFVTLIGMLQETYLTQGWSAETRLIIQKIGTVTGERDLNVRRVFRAMEADPTFNEITEEERAEMVKPPPSFAGG